MAALPQPSSLAARRDARPLPFLKTSFDDDALLEINSPRFPRASKSTTNLKPPSRRPSQHQTEPTDSLKSPSLKKARTKSNLFHLFSKPKVERAPGYNEPGMSPPTPGRHAPNFSRPSLADRRPSAGRASSSRDKPYKLYKTHAQNSTQSTIMLATPRLPSRGRDASSTNDSGALNSSSKPLSSVSPSSTSFHPPLLSQALPQAILYAELEDPNRHTLRLSRPKRKDRSPSGYGESRPHKFQPVKHGRRRPSIQKSVSSMNSKDGSTGDVAQKRYVYILAASGHVLQYSGEGSAERPPEKVLKLGPESVAYASDAIPGKHWVIQILQVASDDELNPFTAERSFFGRLLPTSRAKKKATRSMLLVLESPADMNKWMLSIRQEIQKLRHGCSGPSAPSRKAQANKEAAKAQQKSHRVLTMTRTATPCNVSIPPSPLKSQPSGPSVPTSPSFPDSGYISSGTTLTCDMSSTRSSRYQGHAKAPSEIQKVANVPPDASLRGQAQQRYSSSEYGDGDGDATTTAIPLQPPNTAIPPLTPSTPNVNIQLADSPDQLHPSPEQRRLSMDSRKEFSEQSFYIPMAAPMTAVFPHIEEQRGNDLPVPGSPTRQESLASPASSSPAKFPINRSPSLRQSKPVPSLWTFKEADEDEPQQSARFAKPVSDEPTDDLVKRPPLGSTGNAFAINPALMSKHTPTQGSSTSLPLRKPSLLPMTLQPVNEDPTQQQPEKKRTSIRSRAPLPLQIASSAGPSNRTSLRLRDSIFADLGLAIQNIPVASPTSDRNSALQKLTNSQPPSKASPAPSPAHSPTIPVSFDRALRRPPSITVNTGVAPSFLATPRRSSAQGISPASAPAGPVGKTPTPTGATRAFRGRDSVLVPVVRPPIRGERKASNRQSYRIGGPPMSNPPAAPLPPTPPNAQASAASAASAAAVVGH